MLKLFKILAVSEGISYLLFGITMPLKYMADLPTPNYIVGMAHGFLFIAYVVVCILYANKQKWSLIKSLIALAASLVPFATFYIERKFLKTSE